MKSNYVAKCYRECCSAALFNTATITGYININKEFEKKNFGQGQ